MPGRTAEHLKNSKSTKPSYHGTSDFPSSGGLNSILFPFGPESRRDFLGNFAGARQVIGAERDGGDTGMATAAILFAQGGEVHFLRRLFPGICPHRNFRAHWRGAQAHGIPAIGE